MNSVSESNESFKSLRGGLVKVGSGESIWIKDISLKQLNGNPGTTAADAEMVRKQI